MPRMHPEDSSTGSTMICDDSKQQQYHQHHHQQQQQQSETAYTAAPATAQQQQQQQQPLQQQTHQPQHQIPMMMQQIQQPGPGASPQAKLGSPGGQQKKQESWFQSSVLSRTEAYIEAQVLQLTEECRLFSEDQENNASTNNKNINDKQKDLALLQRHEVQISSWGMLGNGAFSEVYSVSGIRLLDDGFSDPTQQEARSCLRDAVSNTTTSPSSSRRTTPIRKQFVMKHLRRDLLQNRKKFVHAAGDLVLEAMYLSRLHHENIIELKGCAVGGPSAYGDGRHDGFFLILERLQCTLSQRIQDWRNASGNGGLMQAGNNSAAYNSIYSSQLKDFEVKLDIAKQVAEALAYLHSRDIIFRDLKPDNIGIAMDYTKTGDTVVKLFDFGLCRELPKAAPTEDQVFHMSGVGTRRYMAPEVFLGQYYNVKADVYSWTMVLHAMLSLQRPYEMYTADLHKMLVCQEGVRPTIFQHWPSPIQSILRTGWAPSSADRPSMKVVCGLLQGILDDIKATKEYEAACASKAGEAESVPGRADVSGSTTSSSSRPEMEETPSYDTIANFIESWTSSLCARSSHVVDTAHEGPEVEKNPQRKNILRTIEAHLVADTAAGGQMMLRNSQSAYNGANRWGAPDRDYQNQFARHMRSSYL